MEKEIDNSIDNSIVRQTRNASANKKNEKKKKSKGGGGEGGERKH